MKIAVCVAENGGITFNGRRVSRDKKILEDMISLFGRVEVGESAFGMFERAGLAEGASVCAEENPDGALFIEKDPAEYYGRAGTAVIYRFNVNYPADVYMTSSPADNGFTLVSVTEFAGETHEKITREVYSK